MCVKEKRCCAWISLNDIGISSDGCIRDSKWLNSISVPGNQSIFNENLYIDLPDRKLTYLRTVSNGKFGSIDEVLYETKNKKQKLYAKKPLISGKSLIYEACIQKLVYEHLINIGFPTGAPKLVTIFQLRDGSVCFAMEQIDNAITFEEFLRSVPKNQLPGIIIDCLLQLCAMVWHLDCIVGINHRDLKPSNFLIVERNTPITKIINVENEILEISSKYDLTFIDFGFSCLGSTETHITDISLSTVYSKTDPCPKEGRDMFLFLSFLYINYHSILPPKLLSLFESWLDVPGSKLCNFMRKDKESCKNWIYYLAGDERITQFHSKPIQIIKDLQDFMNDS
jgi:serine/threonine protein kinase